MERASWKASFVTTSASESVELICPSAMSERSNSTCLRDSSLASAIRSSGSPEKPSARAKRTTLACDASALAASEATVLLSAASGSSSTARATRASAGRSVWTARRMRSITSSMFPPRLTGR